MSTAPKILVTCPPMLGMIDSFKPLFEGHGWQVTAPKVVQTLSVAELTELVPQHDGWIIGDDPATRAVFEAGKFGHLKAAVKWGIGIDNVDVSACEDLEIPITNTPNMFGAEVADIAMGYVIALARETFQIDDGVRQGQWPKPRGISLSGKTVALAARGCGNPFQWNRLCMPWNTSRGWAVALRSSSGPSWAVSSMSASTGSRRRNL